MSLFPLPTWGGRGGFCPVVEQSWACPLELRSRGPGLPEREWVSPGIGEMQQSAQRGPGLGNGSHPLPRLWGASESHEAGANSPWRWVMDWFRQQMFIHGVRAKHLACAEHLGSRPRG